MKGGNEMICPKCKGNTEKVKYGSIEVDRCLGCKGIWFDMLEAEDLKKVKGAEAIDIPDPKIRKKYNKMGDINCPKCARKMIKMVDIDQSHIWFEKCPRCYGVWFDAGEFTDYKEEDKLDKIKDFLTRERK
jgi:Zn-finger nucleic acid-binding protein